MKRFILTVLALLLCGCTSPMQELIKSYEKGASREVAPYLNHENVRVREEAIKLYVKLGNCDAAVYGKQRDSSKDVRMELAKSLKACNTLESMNTLRGLLNDTSSIVKRYAVDSAVSNDSCKSDCLRLLRNLLNDEDSFVRLAAARALYNRFPEESRLAVVESLSSRNHYVKKEAVETLAFFKNPDNVYYLAEFINDPDISVRLAARKSIEAIMGRVMSQQELARIASKEQLDRTPSEPRQPVPVSTRTKEQAADVPQLSDFGLGKTGRTNRNAVAVVIGNRDYSSIDIPRVDYAVRDAQIMRQIFRDVMGVPEDNIKYVENAKSSDFNKIFGTAGEARGLLFNWSTPESDVYVYYSGHGAPDTTVKDAYFVPVDSDINFIRLNGYPVKQLYANLGSLKVKSVTVIIDACFSGISQAGKIIGAASPVFVDVSDSYTLAGSNMVVFTSSKSDEISSWDNKNRFGLFTYHFVNGFKEADSNSDGVITANEMSRYLAEKVPYTARRLINREQSPQVFGNKDMVLIRK